MKCKAEDPSGHFRTAATPSVFEPCKVRESTCDLDILITGWFVVIPLDPPLDPALREGEDLALYVLLMKYTMDCTQEAANQGVAKSGFGWDGPGVSPAEIFEDFWRRIYDYEVGKHAQTKEGRRCCELF